MKCLLQFHWVGVLPLIRHDEWEVQLEPQSPGDWHTYCFHVAGTTPSMCLARAGEESWIQESHLISGRNKTSAYLMQLHSPVKRQEGRDMGRAPEVHPDGHVAASSFSVSQVNTESLTTEKTWRTVFCIEYKINKLQLSKSWLHLGINELGWESSAHPVHLLGIQEVKATWERENFLQQLQQLLR